MFLAQKTEVFEQLCMLAIEQQGSSLFSHVANAVARIDIASSMWIDAISRCLAAPQEETQVCWGLGSSLQSPTHFV